MENEEFLGPKTGHRSGPARRPGGGPYGLCVPLDSIAVPPEKSADSPRIPSIPGLIGVTAHYHISVTVLLTTKTSDQRGQSRVRAHVNGTQAVGHSWLWSFSRGLSSI